MEDDRPDGVPSEQDILSRFDTTVAHPARVYDAWLDGKDNFEADRVAAEAGKQAFPAIMQAVRANRAFLARAVEYLVAEAGIRQFLDIGTGLPSANNTHEVARAIAPECRVVYVDNDPIVLRHAQVLLSGSGTGETDYLDADARDPGKILENAARTLDFSRPVAVMLLGVLHFISEDEDPYRISGTIADALCPGSYMAVSHVAGDLLPDRTAAMASAVNVHMSTQGVLRDRGQVERIFGGLEVVEPGVVPVTEWRPRSGAEAAAPAILWAGVARKTT